MRIAYVCDKKKSCKETPRCGDICNHTLFEEHALYPEHGKFRIFGDTGEGFTLEELKRDGKDPARVEAYGNEGGKQ